MVMGFIQMSVLEQLFLILEKFTGSYLSKPNSRINGYANKEEKDIGYTNKKEE